MRFTVSNALLYLNKVLYVATEKESDGPSGLMTLSYSKFPPLSFPHYLECMSVNLRTGD